MKERMTFGERSRLSVKFWNYWLNLWLASLILLVAGMVIAGFRGIGLEAIIVFVLSATCFAGGDVCFKISMKLDR